MGWQALQVTDFKDPIIPPCASVSRAQTSFERIWEMQLRYVR
jgi:hypothetical protein